MEKCVVTNILDIQVFAYAPAVEVVSTRSSNPLPKGAGVKVTEFFGIVFHVVFHVVNVSPFSMENKTMDVFGQTRSRVARDYALITPDTHVNSPLIGWTQSTGIVHISPELGARFVQYSANMETGGSSAMPAQGVERMIYVESGSVNVKLADQSKTLGQGGFAFLPAGVEHKIDANSASTLIVFEKLYAPLDGAENPAPVLGESKNVEGEAFMGDPDAVLQTLIPISPAYDMAVNIFTYQPGATLPQVEIHVMEHGLQMIAGQGVYRLSGDYHPVARGDVIWMAPYCPQWFVAMGKEPATYIYYKDIHRDRITDRQEAS